MAVYPVDEILGELKDAVIVHSGVVLSAPPGAGKTTRVPLALLDVIPRDLGRIVMLEPRRLAATSAARWMAQSLGEQVGQTVGYSIRFDSRTSEKTRVEVVTEGILTRRMQADPGLGGVAMVIFDEFHERSVHTDLGLCLCQELQKHLRYDLKILVMSATIDCGPIAALLGGAPVIASEGRAFPVEERYMEEQAAMPPVEKVTKAVGKALRETTGDILVFLPGVREIRRCHDALREVLSTEQDGIDVRPLYGDLPFEDQERVILPSQHRKIVLATNIAETSLTIEGIRAVIDSGLTRRLQYDPSSGMNRLITVNVSGASAEQRKGRAGRLGPGICYRLYSRHVFQSMVPFAPPEILISDLSSLVLELALWGVQDPSGLSWLDAPPDAAWKSAERLLMDLGALDRKGSVTNMGKAMAGLPLHPRLGRLLLRAAELGCTGLGADLAAILSERDAMQRRTSDPAASGRDSGITERIEALRAWRAGKAPPGVDVWALRTIERTYKQIMRLMDSNPDALPAGEDDADLIPRLLLCAYPDRIAKRREEGLGRFVLSQGRGIRLPAASSLGNCPYIIAVNLDAGEKAEGSVHLAEPVREECIRQECRGRIGDVRRIAWDKKEKRIIAVTEERLGSIPLSTKPFIPSDEEAVPLLCEAIRSRQVPLSFSTSARQFQGRVILMRRAFPEEHWPDLSDEHLYADPGDWLNPWLGSVRSAADIEKVDLLSALRSRLSHQQQRLLDKRLPLRMMVPSGSMVAVDYAAGELPVLAVKLQEMFGLADTPVVAEGRVKIVLHLLSPARRPVQVTQNLRGFWNSGYQQVKKELKGRYPKHPWPDDPWNAAPTRKIKPHGR